VTRTSGTPTAFPADYSAQDHDTWSKVFDSYTSRLETVACAEVIDGFERLGLTGRIGDLAKLSDRVEGLCGWRLEPVDGLVSGTDFASMLRDRRYPITVHMRAPEEAEFSMLPDLFHDVVGHLPLLIYRPYTKFLENFAVALTASMSSARAVTALSRFFWHTTEIGLAGHIDRPKVFGAAILTSSAECSRAVAPSTLRVPFDLDELGRTGYDIYEVQASYFVTEGLDQMFETGPELEAWARRAATSS
jgi:phenylalanine-4-hydroxylase